MSQFDALAPTYDDAFTHSEIGSYLRGRVHARLMIHFRPGSHVLELGCGTGEDALYLSQQGVRVVATDASAAMLHAARSKLTGNRLVLVDRLDLNQLHDTHFPMTFDGVFSSFGPLNCLNDRRGLAEWLANRIKPGGTAAFGVMSPLCLWELLWHGAHFNFKTATRRWRKYVHFQAHAGTPPLHVYYPSIRHLTRQFWPYFTRTHVEAVGLFLPPSDVFGAIEKRPKLFHLLKNLETRFAKYSKLALLADHYWIEFQRKPD